MTRIIKQHIRQVPRTLIKPRRLPIKRPRLARRPFAAVGRRLEARAVEPVQVVDHFFGAEVVADEVLVAAEEEDAQVL